MKRCFLFFCVPVLLAGCGSTVSSSNDSEELAVAGGEVQLGVSDEAQIDSPLKSANVTSFKIDKTEVTNAQYRACVDAGACSEPSQYGFDSIPDYYNEKDYDNYPVTYVTWFQAQSYCDWRGKRLPTEAEWETAARGSDGRTYPWGEASPDCTLAHTGACTNPESGLSSPLEVGSLPDGAAPSGALDMAGNMAEWVADWYDSRSYNLWEDGEAPASPEAGRFKSVRGGSWWCDTDRLPAYRREPMHPMSRAGNIGFRCAR